MGQNKKNNGKNSALEDMSFLGLDVSYIEGCIDDMVNIDVDLAEYMALYKTARVHYEGAIDRHATNRSYLKKE